MAHTVSKFDEDCARRSGVYLIKLNCKNSYVAIDSTNGTVIRNGTEQWVTSQLKKENITIVESGSDRIVCCAEKCISI